MDGSKISRLVTLIFMWVIWSAVLLGVAILLAFAYLPAPESSKWFLELPWMLAVAVFLSVPLSLRFLVIPRINNPWLVFLVFIVGISLAEMIAVVGMFALTSGQNTYILLGVATLLLYCPQWLTSRSHQVIQP